MITRSLARRYAVALADVVTPPNTAHSANLAYTVHDELQAWGTLMKDNPALVQVFRNPTIPQPQKISVLQTLIARTNVSVTTANFLKVLLQNHRLADLSEVNEAFNNELDRRGSIVAANITTAREVTTEEQAALQNQIQSMVGGRVRLNFAVDENLIGGVVTRIGSTVFDGSVRNQLDEIRDKLKGERI